MSVASLEEIRSHYRLAGKHFPMLDAETPGSMGLRLVDSAAGLAGSDAVSIGAPDVAGDR